MTSSSVPPLAERERPGLSETLTGPKAPDRCQSCGAGPGAAANDVERVVQQFAPLPRWLECDPWDRDTATVVVLCRRCSDRLIEPHQRLYRSLWPDQPHPGCMPICGDCRHREGVRCSHPNAKANGGTGVLLSFEHPPALVHLCYQVRGGGRRGERRWMYSRVTRCRQKETV